MRKRTKDGGKPLIREICKRARRKLWKITKMGL